MLPGWLAARICVYNKYKYVQLFIKLFTFESALAAVSVLDVFGILNTSSRHPLDVMALRQPNRKSVRRK